MVVASISGCAKKQDSMQETTHEVTETATELPTQPSEAKGIPSKTCAELDGDICEAGEECTGEWLYASDTFSCCSKKCEYEGGQEIITIEAFELSEENEELGDLV
jgi:hypothetical protein